MFCWLPDILRHSGIVIDFLGTPFEIVGIEFLGAVHHVLEGDIIGPVGFEGVADDNLTHTGIGGCQAHGLVDIAVLTIVVTALHIAQASHLLVDLGIVFLVFGVCFPSRIVAPQFLGHIHRDARHATFLAVVAQVDLADASVVAVQDGVAQFVGSALGYGRQGEGDIVLAAALYLIGIHTGVPAQVVALDKAGIGTYPHVAAITVLGIGGEIDVAVPIAATHVLTDVVGHQVRYHAVDLEAQTLLHQVLSHLVVV